MTAVCSRMRAPPSRAAAASAWVTSVRLAIPSPGRNAAPTTPDGSSSGHISAASAGLIGWTSKPHTRAIEICRRTSVQRSSVVARRIDPVRRNPVPSPVSRSSSGNSSALYLASMLML